MYSKRTLGAVLLSLGLAATILPRALAAQEENRSLPPEVQALQKKAAEARVEAQAVELEAARAQVKASEAELTLADAVAKYAKDLAEKDKKAKEWAKQTQKTASLVRQNLEAARQRLDLILHPPPGSETAVPGLSQASKQEQKPGEKLPKMEDAGYQEGR